MLFILIINPSSRKHFRHMLNFAGDFIYAISDISPSIHSVCDRLANYLATSTLKVLMVLALGLVFVGAVPLYKFLLYGEREMVIPVILPFVDPETDNGYSINLTNQMLWFGFGSLIVPSSEVITCILKNCTSASAAIIENLLAEFEKSLNGNFTKERTLHYKNITMQMLDWDRFDLT